MSKTTPLPSLPAIHAVYQFEAFHALRFLGNLLRDRPYSVNGGRSLFGAVGVVATGRDVKADFASLSGEIASYRFAWDGNSLEATIESNRNVIRRGTFEVDFGNAPVDFFEELWDCPQPEVRDCVRASVVRLAESVKKITPSPAGGVQKRFDALSRRLGLSDRERDLLLLGLCVSHNLLELDLEGSRCRFLDRAAEAALYLGCGIDDIIPLVRTGSRLVASGVLDDDFTPSRDALSYLEGRDRMDAIRAQGFVSAGDDCGEELLAGVSEDDYLG